MPYPIKNELLVHICKEPSFNRNLKEQLIKIAFRIINNINTISVDCNPRVNGDPGYQAFLKFINFAKKINENVDSEIGNFITHLVALPNDNSEIWEWLMEIDNNNTSEVIVDQFLQNKEYFYNYLNITIQDLN